MSQMMMSQATRKARKQKKVQEEEPDLEGYGYFKRPHRVTGDLADKVVTGVFAGNNICYALVQA